MPNELKVRIAYYRSKLKELDNNLLLDYIIGIGTELPPYPQDKKTTLYRVHGCFSATWIYQSIRGETLLPLYAESGSSVSKGLAAMIGCLTEGLGVPQAKHLSAVDLRSIGVGRILGPQRSTGLDAMLNHLLTRTLKANPWTQVASEERK